MLFLKVICCLPPGAKVRAIAQPTNNGVKHGEQKEEKNAREDIDEVNSSQAGVE
jgi:hypothetical protein